MAIDIELTDSERALLLAGINEWSGPASLTDELALAMGFADCADFFANGERMRRLLKSESAMEARDWTRVLVMTEFVFASCVFGSGLDWSITTGIPDEEAIGMLRSLQKKLLKAGARQGQFGPSAHQEFQWHVQAGTAIRVYKNGRSDLQDLLAALVRTTSSFGDDLAALERLKAGLEPLLDLPDAEQRQAVLDEISSVTEAIANTPGQRRFWI